MMSLTSSSTKYSTGKVSCILPTYNRAEFLKTTLRSLKEQTYKNLEIIVVDDGSEQNMQGLCDGKCDKFIRLKENSGSVSIPRAVGITHATGEYIAHIDDDIWMSPTKIETLVSSLESSPAKLCYGNMSIFKQGVQTGQSRVSNWDPTLPQGWGVDGSQFIYRADVYERVPLIFCRRGCDWNTAKSIREHFDIDFVHVDEEVSRYFWHDSNRSLREETKTLAIHPKKFEQYFLNPKNRFKINYEAVS